MSEDKSSYKQIFKTTFFLGGVQVVSILLNLIRSKVVAVFLGPAGMGFSSLYVSASNMLGGITGLGLGFSAVRDISQASESNDLEKLSTTVKIFQNWVWFSSILGAVAMICFSPLLSQWTFGDDLHVVAFIVLSLLVLCNTLNSRYVALLQGTRRFKYMAKGTVIGSAFALIVTIPLYYFFREKAIVIALVIAAFCTLAVNYYFAKKQPLTKVQVSLKDSFYKGLDMAKIGVVMMISSCIGTLCIYLVNAFIRHTGSVSDVGLYQAGIGMTTQYIGLVFMAMGTEYYPRLVAIHEDNEKVKDAVNQQSVIITLIAAPLLCILILFVPFVIKLLFSSEFLSIITFTRWIALGMFFKVIAFALGFVSFAKGDKKFFFFVEGIGSNVVPLVLNIISYYRWGLDGLGVSFFVSYLIYFVSLFFLTHERYGFSYTKKFLRLAMSQFPLCVIVFLISILVNDNIYLYTFGSLFVLISCYYSYKELDKIIGVKNLFFKFVKKEK